MAGTVKIISGTADEYSLNMTVEYNSNDAYLLVWQEPISVPRMSVKDVVDFDNFLAKNIIPEAANKINARRRVVDITPAFQAAVTNGTLYVVPGS